MGKRSHKFKKHDRNYYPTPLAPLRDLAPFLPQGATYAEPCAGNGALIRGLKTLRPDTVCVYAGDIKPMTEGIARKNALEITPDDLRGADLIITNPPWDRDILHALIPFFTRLRTTWLLFDADWVHTLQARPHLPFCRRIVSVGRVKWFPESDNDGMDNAAWYEFVAHETATLLVPRRADVDK